MNAKYIEALVEKQYRAFEVVTYCKSALKTFARVVLFYDYKIRTLPTAE